MGDPTQKKCILCKGGASPLQGETLRSFSMELGGGWQVIEEHHLKKEYRFKNFKEALFFINLIGAIAEEEKHHPDLYLTWGKVDVTIWTHAIDGLSESDFILASKIDAQYLSHFDISRK